MLRWLVPSVLLAACGGGQRFGKIVTEITPSPKSPNLLLVKSCELLETGKANIDGVELGDCKRYGVRRSPIMPVPVVEARVLARENRIVTGFAERPNGGAIVTTCRIGKTRDQKWALLDCSETEIATAPLDAAATPAAPDPAAPTAAPTPPAVPAPAVEPPPPVSP